MSPPVSNRPELPKCLTVSLGLRMPLFEKGHAPAEKISEMEDYLLLSSWTQGELTEERVRWLMDKVAVQHEWDHLTGWEELRRTRTETAVTQAKRQVRPDLYDRLQEIEWMVRRLGEEIDRMEREATKASRAYTLMTGG